MPKIYLFKKLLLLIVLIFSFSSLSASPKKEIKFKGWLDTEFIGNNKEETNSYFDVHHLYLITEIFLEEGFSGFAELEFEHAPNTSSEKGEISLDRLYIQKDFSENLSLRAGKFGTPFGHWTPTHWAILVETITKPLHESNKYIPAKSVGLETFGIIFLKEHELEWKLFLSNGSETDGTDKMDDVSFGGGGDLRFIHSDGNSFLGTSYYHQHNPKYDGREEDSFVGYGGVTLGEFDLRGEYIYQSRSDGTSGLMYDDVSTYYITGKFQLNSDLALGSRYDDGDDERGLHFKAHTMTSLFFNWTPIPEIIGKIEYDFHHFDDDLSVDYNSWALYIGLVF